MLKRLSHNVRHWIGASDVVGYGYSSRAQRGPACLHTRHTLPAACQRPIRHAQDAAQTTTQIKHRAWQPVSRHWGACSAAPTDEIEELIRGDPCTSHRAPCGFPIHWPTKNHSLPQPITQAHVSTVEHGGTPLEVNPRSVRDHTLCACETQPYGYTLMPFTLPGLMMHHLI